MHTFKNDSVLPTLLEHESQVRFSKTAFTDDQILKILKAFVTQSECWNYVTNLSLHTYSYCSRIVLILELSQTLGKTQILCPPTKKGDKQIVCNYRLVSLLLILGKIFERGFWRE